MTSEKQPPQDVDAERSLLGALIMAPKVLVDVVDVLAAEDFYRPAHAAIYGAILDIVDRGDVPDPVTISERLSALGTLERCGGGTYVFELYSLAQTAANVPYFVDIITGKAALRRTAEAAVSIYDMAHGDVMAEDVAGLLEQARAAIDKATTAFERRRDDEGTFVGDLAVQTLERYAQPRPHAVPTGFADLDELLDGGLRPGTLTVIGARPSVGKSICGLQIAVNAVRSSGIGAMFASLEMPRSEVMDRVYAQLGGIELRRLTKHQLTQHDWELVRYWSGQLQDTPLRIEDTPHMSMTKLRGLARDLTRHKAGCGLVVADYLQLMTSGKRAESRQLEVAEFSRQLKVLAKELKCPVVALSQLNRSVEARSTPRPVLADLRESGAIEQDADNVLLLWDNPEREGERQLVVAKNRQGPLGDVRLSWAPYYARAGSLSHLNEA